uniref:Uncharacterized protein n=1 Tax=Cucumis melo TaxID=3656 RepID=A0A9I9E3W9_CUCME
MIELHRLSRTNPGVKKQQGVMIELHRLSEQT